MKPGRLSLVMTQALFACGIAQAAGFGDITLHNRIGEKLRAEVPLFVGPNETPDPRCFSLAPLPGSDLPVIASARIGIVRKASGHVLVIESNQIVDEPLMQIGLRAACGSNQQRDYILMPEAAAPRTEAPPPSLPMARAFPPAQTPAAPIPVRAAPRLSPPPGKPATKAVTKPGAKQPPKPTAKASQAPKIAPRPIARPQAPAAPRAAATPRPIGDRLQISQAPTDLGSHQATLEHLGEMESRVLRMESSLSSLREEVDHLHSAVELGAQVAAAKHELRLAQSLESPIPTAPPPEPPRQSSFGNWLQLLASALVGGFISALLAVYLSKRLSRPKSSR